MVVAEEDHAGLGLLEVAAVHLRELVEEPRPDVPGDLDPDIAVHPRGEVDAEPLDDGEAHDDVGDIVREVALSRDHHVVHEGLQEVGDHRVEGAHRDGEEHAEYGEEPVGLDEREEPFAGHVEVIF